MSRVSDCEHFHNNFSSGGAGAWSTNPPWRYGRCLCAIMNFHWSQCAISRVHLQTGTLIHWRSLFGRLSFHFRLTGVQMRGIFQVLRSHLPIFYRNRRALYRTPMLCPSTPLGNGSYVHLEIEDAAWRQLQSVENLPSQLQLQLNCDRTTLFNQPICSFGRCLQE